jgi:hypothetical protein
MEPRTVGTASLDDPAEEATCPLRAELYGNRAPAGGGLSGSLPRSIPVLINAMISSASASVSDRTNPELSKSPFLVQRIFTIGCPVDHLPACHLPILRKRICP